MLDEDDENVGTPPSDEEMVAQLQAVEESIKPDNKSAWPWAVVENNTEPTETLDLLSRQRLPAC